VASFLAQSKMARPRATGIATALGLVREADATYDEYPVRSVVHPWRNASIVHGLHFSFNPVLGTTPSQGITATQLIVGSSN
jgi:hypothetical protein